VPVFLQRTVVLNRQPTAAELVAESGTDPFMPKWIHSVRFGLECRLRTR
jgi:hypothetical protein